MNKGQSLFEVVMALSVISIIIFGIVILAVTSIANSNYSRNKALATNYSQEALEWIRGQRDASWSTFYSKTDQKWCMNSEPISDWGVSSSIGCSSSSYLGSTNLFKREAVLTTVEANVNVQVQVKVYWSDAQGYHEVSSITNFTNFKAK